MEKKNEKGESKDKRNIVLLITHGMGKQDENSFGKMCSKLGKKINKHYSKNNGKRRIIIAPVNWASVTQEKQTLLGDNLMKKKNHKDCNGKKRPRARLCWKFTRRFILDFISDAIAYQQSEHDQKMYNDIHQEFKTVLNDIVEEAGSDAFLCIYAHSLGTVIVNNFIYDMQESSGESKTLETLGTLKSLYTTGSPYALWTIRHQTEPPFGKPITVEKWINFYSKNDILAYPLGNLNDKYHDIRCEGTLIDKKVCAGGFLLGWGPLSHNGYKTNRKVIKNIAEDLLRI